jgi:hypothetical protein
MDETTQPDRRRPCRQRDAALRRRRAVRPGQARAAPLPAGRGRVVERGWQVFMAAPGIWIATILVFVLIMLGLAFVPILGSIAGSVLTPVFGGIALGCHALAKAGRSRSAICSRDSRARASCRSSSSA